MSLPGVNAETMTIDPSTWDPHRYDEINCQLLAYTRKYLTTKALAQYILAASGNLEAKTILFKCTEAAEC